MDKWSYRKDVQKLAEKYWPQYDALFRQHIIEDFVEVAERYIPSKNPKRTSKS